jgi:hypothetical protein
MSNDSVGQPLLLTLTVHLALWRVRRSRLLLVVGRIDVVGRAIICRSRVLTRLVANRGQLYLSTCGIRRGRLAFWALRVWSAVLSLSRGSCSGLCVTLAVCLLSRLPLLLLLLLARLPLFPYLLEFCHAMLVSTPPLS